MENSENPICARCGNEIVEFGAKICLGEYICLGCYTVSADRDYERMKETTTILKEN